MDLLARWTAVLEAVVYNLGGGPRVKAAHVINLQKGGTLFFVLGLMALFDCWTPTAWTYAALHGSYGLCWLLKDRLFPDRNWERPITLPSAAVMGTFLVLYWLSPILIVTRRVEAPTWLLAFATFVYALGVVLMMGADAQKYFTLQVKRALITTGFFARVRHPNYLGEMLLYGAFASLALHWAPWVVLAAVWTGFFLPNILNKERSMSRYPEWAAYVARTGALLPGLSAAPPEDAAWRGRVHP